MKDFESLDLAVQTVPEATGNAVAFLGLTSGKYDELLQSALDTILPNNMEYFFAWIDDEVLERIVDNSKSDSAVEDAVNSILPKLETEDAAVGDAVNSLLPQVETAESTLEDAVNTILPEVMETVGAEVVIRADDHYNKNIYDGTMDGESTIFYADDWMEVQEDIVIPMDDDTEDEIIVVD